jgi:hypothetical protein
MPGLTVGRARGSELYPVPSCQQTSSKRPQNSTICELTRTSSPRDLTQLCAICALVPRPLGSAEVAIQTIADERA